MGSPARVGNSPIRRTARNHPSGRWSRRRVKQRLTTCSTGTAGDGDRRGPANGGSRHVFRRARMGMARPFCRFHAPRREPAQRPEGGVARGRWGRCLGALPRPGSSRLDGTRGTGPVGVRRHLDVPHGPAHPRARLRGAREHDVASGRGGEVGRCDVVHRPRLARGRSGRTTSRPLQLADRRAVGVKPCMAVVAPRCRRPRRRLGCRHRDGAGQRQRPGSPGRALRTRHERVGCRRVGRSLRRR